MPKKREYRRPWWVSCRWAVWTWSKRPGEGWVEIYNTETRRKAEQDAKDWHAETGQKVEVRPGPGHRKNRT